MIANAKHPDVSVYRIAILLLASVCFILGQFAGTWWSLLIFVPLFGIAYLVDKLGNMKLTVTIEENDEGSTTR